MGKLPIKISDKVLKKLTDFEDGVSGTLLTFTSKTQILILGLVVTKTSDGNDVTTMADKHVPGGIEDSASFFVTPDLKFADVDRDLIILAHPLTKEVTGYNDGVSVDVEVISEAEIAKSFYLIRNRIVIPSCCELTEAAFESLINNLQSKVTGFKILELENIPSNEPYKTSGNKKNVSSLKDMGIVDCQLLLKNGSDQENPARNAVLIDYKKQPAKCCWFDLTLDVLTLVSKNEVSSKIRNLVAMSLERGLNLVKDCLISQLTNTSNISLPETFHFLLDDVGIFISVVYPKNKLDRDLGDLRATLHTAFALPTDRPLLMRGNALSFTSEEAGGELLCPHESVGPSGVVGGDPALVQGRYTYHHYCQKGMNDDGWGCAYRSLQTLCSWFKLQGYTNKSVPTLKEIQQCLVRIGDKPSSFVGSSQWIGSTEVGFCLDTLLGVSCRIVNVSSGDEMSMKGGELTHHFRTQGTPVMIGGANLAHTILGVDYNKKTGDIKFLILDPHYTGGEDLNTIISKGWCGWKPLSFWKKSSFYNMCMPIRPKYI